ncbi:MAG: hypothetical protein QM781_17220 [Chitinophagaceae bacterium]
MAAQENIFAGSNCFPKIIFQHEDKSKIYYRYKNLDSYLSIDHGNPLFLRQGARCIAFISANAYSDADTRSLGGFCSNSFPGHYA